MLYRYFYDENMACEGKYIHNYSIRVNELKIQEEKYVMNPTGLDP
jgi:hypothetical protein